MGVNYADINNSKLTDILRGAEKAHARLVEAGEAQGALAVQRLIRSRLAANSENRRVNREYRQALAQAAELRAEVERLRACAEDATKALPVLIAMLKTAGLGKGANVAIAMLDDARAALQASGAAE